MHTQMQKEINPAGEEVQESKHGLLTTIGFQLGPQEPPQYALEGSIAIGGAGVSWLRDQLGLIESAEQSEQLAGSVDNTAGEHCVPKPCKADANGVSL